MGQKEGEDREIEMNSEKKIINKCLWIDIYIYNFIMLKAKIKPLILRVL